MTTTTTHEKTHETIHETPRATAEHAARTWQDEYFRFVKRIEAPVLRTTTRVAERFAEIVPTRPGFLASMPKAHAVRDVMDTGFTFRKRMVEEQTMFARRMMKAIEPVLVSLDNVPPSEPVTQMKQAMSHATTRAKKASTEASKRVSATRKAERTTDHRAA